MNFHKFEDGEKVLGNKTVLTPAKKGSESLRATVPVNIVRQFNFKAGDKFDWSLVVKDGKIGVEIYFIKTIPNAGQPSPVVVSNLMKWELKGIDGCVYEASPDREAVA